MIVALQYEFFNKMHLVNGKKHPFLEVSLRGAPAIISNYP